MKRIMSKYELPNSALKYVLESLIPYTDANMKLSFSPNVFFNDLEKIDWLNRINKQKPKQYRQYRKQSIRKAFYKAKKQNLITYKEGIPQLTEQGRKAIKPYKPRHLGAQSYVIVSFDIPEQQRDKRSIFRGLLKELGFELVQQSVWKSRYDHINLLQHETRRLGIGQYVNIYESVRVDI